MRKALLFLVVALGFMPTAFSQTKDNVARECVLFEIFTGVRCQYCPAAANGVAQMLEEGLAIAPVAYHTSAFSTAEFYTNETNARASYYGIASYPTLKADGVLTVEGGGHASENMYSYYISRYNQRVNVASPFTIDLSLEPVDGTTCRVNCTVTQVGDCSGNDVRVFIALTQCNLDVTWNARLAPRLPRHDPFATRHFVHRPYDDHQRDHQYGLSQGGLLSDRMGAELFGR